MRTPNDALRSVAEYLALSVLPQDEDWEVRLAIEEGTFVRPFCRVGWAGAAAHTIRRPHTDVLRPLALHLFPKITGTPENMTLEGGRIEHLLHVGFGVGVGAGRPARLPLWNFDGVPLDRIDTDPQPVRGPNDYMRLRAFTVGRNVDPDDERAVVVTADLRLHWTMQGGDVAHNLNVPPVTPTPDVPPPVEPNEPSQGGVRVRIPLTP
jgi:hypothetical protein